MKKIAAALASAALLAGFSACDKHSWEDSEDGKTPGTKHLFEPHGSHGGHGDKAGDGKEKEGE